MVQQELHSEDERRKGDGDSGEPIADPPAPGVSEAVAIEQPLPLPGFEPRVEADSAGRFGTPETPDAHAPSALDRAFPPQQAAAIRGEIEDRSAQVVRRIDMVRDEFVAWVKTLASAAVYATLIVTFGFQVARVEGQSMAPTLQDQDRLIVNKLAYRLRDPQVGDIVMLYYPNNPEKSFVKRVIAEENDTVRIVAGRVYRNDVLMDDSFVPPEYRSHDDWGPEVIPEGYYFVMGDHRNNSSDSRHWRFVPKKYIIGKVQLRWWPVPEARIF